MMDGLTVYALHSNYIKIPAKQVEKPYPAFPQSASANLAYHKNFFFSGFKYTLMRKARRNT